MAHGGALVTSNLSDVIWLEFVVGPLPALRVFSRFSSFLPSTKNNNSTSHLDQDEDHRFIGVYTVIHLPSITSIIVINYPS